MTVIRSLIKTARDLRAENVTFKVLDYGGDDVRFVSSFDGEATVTTMYDSVARVGSEGGACPERREHPETMFEETFSRCAPRLARASHRRWQRLPAPLHQVGGQGDGEHAHGGGQAAGEGCRPALPDHDCPAGDELHARREREQHELRAGAARHPVARGWRSTRDVGGTMLTQNEN